jgi:hypothetical protein
LKVLFQVKNTATGKLVVGADFEDKQLAKQKRRELNGKTKEGEEHLVHVVTLGPDHFRYEAEKKPVVRHARRKKDEVEDQEPVVA